jgi:hypothetical protein
MSRTPINTGSAINAGDSDSIRGGLIASEDNFVELYSQEITDIFPATSSISNPTQIKSSVGDTILGVTGSIEAINVSSSFGIELGTFDGTFGNVVGNISHEYQANWILNKKMSTHTDVFLFKSRTSAGSSEAYLLLAGKNFTVKKVTFNGAFNNASWVIKGNGNQTLINGDGTSNTIGINTLSSTSNNKQLHIDGAVSSSDYFSTNFPTSDPEVEGQFFITSSSEVMGRFAFDVLCVSQG